MDNSSAHSSTLLTDREAHRSAEDAEAERERKTLAKKEDKAIGYLRILVFLLLVGVAALVATFIYRYVDSEQTEDFESDFQAHAFKIIESFEKTMSGKVETMDALAMQYTAYAKETGATWPNVSLPNFEWKANSARILSEVMLINENIIVSNEDRAGFEAYYAEHVFPEFEAQMVVEQEQRFYQDLQMGYNTTKGPESEGEYFWRGILAMTPQATFEPAPPGEGPHVVWTKSNPISARGLQNVLGLDTMSLPHARADAQRIMDSKKAIVTAAENYEGDLTNVANYLKEVLRVGQYRHNEEELHLDPTSSFMYPIFDEFGDHDERKVVGMLISTMYWKYYFQHILPPNARGITCVLQNSANQSLTYRVDGPDSVFVGGGDLHDKKYTSMKVSERLSEFIVGTISPETKSFSSTEIDFDYLDWTISVYPSPETEDQYVNNDPLIFTLVVVSVFCFTSLVFIIYDRLVARRQRIVMDRAIASGNIVASLYPAQVREQIYQEGNKDKRVSKATEERGERHQIAQKYEATTIMFADLAGFTNWSSTREPHHVFELLEAIYKEFDLIAQRRGVFKVETVGDCYVAATGLPNPQEKHAVIMAKFAYDCLNKVTDVVHSLVDVLGPETADLQLRVGLHSGSVTGGVLRGQKSRFALFGDTMNTASRMESNGEKGRIQVSQETADELKRFGKGAWLTPREGKISAKGKGELQTYWLQPVAEDATTLRSSAMCSTTREEDDEDDADDAGVIPEESLEA